MNYSRGAQRCQLLTLSMDGDLRTWAVNDAAVAACGHTPGTSTLNAEAQRKASHRQGAVVLCHFPLTLGFCEVIFCRAFRSDGVMMSLRAQSWIGPHIPR